MRKYIELTKVLSELGLDHNDYVYIDKNEVAERIKKMPSIDIVRCRECKYKRINEDDETRYYYCALEDRPNRQWSVDDTDFCSWGEVRDE